MSANKRDQWFAAPMFCASLSFLIVLGGALHLQSAASWPAGVACWIGLAAVYCAFPFELLVRYLGNDPRWRQYVLYCAIPPLRLAARDQQTGNQMWLPPGFWLTVDRKLHRSMRHAFSGPMILIALMIVPILACEFLWIQFVLERPHLRLIIDVGTAVVWTSFALEFLMMVAIVERKVEYCKRHWLDLAIIALPLLAAARLVQISRLVRLNQLTRAARVYRLRGLVLRAYRGLLVLDVLARIQPESRLRRLRDELERKTEEIEHLREEILELEQTLRARESKSEDRSLQETS